MGETIIGSNDDADRTERIDANDQMRDLSSRQPSTFEAVCHLNGVDPKDFLARVALLDTDAGAQGLRD